jgi:hypothetical protein
VLYDPVPLYLVAPFIQILYRKTVLLLPAINMSESVLHSVLRISGLDNMQCGRGFSGTVGSKISDYFTAMDFHGDIVHSLYYFIIP